MVYRGFLSQLTLLYLPNAFTPLSVSSRSQQTELPTYLHCPQDNVQGFYIEGLQHNHCPQGKALKYKSLGQRPR